MFPPTYRYFKKIRDTDPISVWESKWLSDEIIKAAATPDNSGPPSLIFLALRQE